MEPRRRDGQKKLDNQIVQMKALGLKLFPQLTFPVSVQAVWAGRPDWGNHYLATLMPVGNYEVRCTERVRQFSQMFCCKV